MPPRKDKSFYWTYESEHRWLIAEEYNRRTQDFDLPQVVARDIDPVMGRRMEDLLNEAEDARLS